jgi:acetate kinase
LTPTRVLVVNAGSSTLKLAVIDDSAARVSETIDTAGGQADDEQLRAFINEHGPYDAAGHRIVHGGAEFTAPVVIDADVLQQLHALTDLAPLHQPRSLAALSSVSQLLPQVPAVACFDTAFHAHMPAAASTYALPAEWRSRWPLRRFGFHGLSHAYASRRVAELMSRGRRELRIVTCHLGAGASLAAVSGGRSVDTTMGFTPLEGLVMATRSGSVDPGLVLWLQEHAGLPSAQILAGLEHRSGLLGLAGTGDMKRVLDHEAAGDEDAKIAVAVYLHRLRSGIAAMAAAMNGLDALVFTGGVGEHEPAIRARAAAGLDFLGVSVDDKSNQEAEPEMEITGAEGAARTWVVAAREDLEIVRQVGRALRGS